MQEDLNLPADVAGKVWHCRLHEQVRAFHRHAELELNLVIHGQATYLLSDGKYALQAGDVIWLFPAQEHILLNQSFDFEMWVAVWKLETVMAAITLDANHTLLEQHPPGNFHRRLPANRARRLGVLCEEISAGDKDRQNSGLSYLLLLAWAEFNSTDQNVRGENVHPCVERAARLLHDDEEMSLPALAREVGLSPSRLSRLFKQQAGMPLSEFRNRRRIERFFQIYGGRRQSLSEAALAAGFGSYAQFHRVFKSVVGQSPAQYGRDTGNIKSEVRMMKLATGG